MTAAATDLLVIGGGPAGLAIAIRARLAGLSVRVLERSRPPIDKACGEGLMPDAVARLAELGVELPPGECHPLRGIRYLDGDTTAEALFPGSRGLGVRRVHLHAALVRRAEQVGVELCWGVAVTGLAGAAARWVIGADGLLSRVRRWADLAGPRQGAWRRPPRRAARFGIRRHFAREPWSDLVEVHWGPGCEAYVTPVGPREIGVAMLWSDRGQVKVGWRQLMAHFPALAARLDGAPVTSRDRGAGPLLQRTAAVVRGNVALIGDAAGYVDAITGEGLAVALHQAAALVEALAPAAAMGRGATSPLDDPALVRYAAAHRRIVRLPERMTLLLLAIERRPWLRRRAVRALAAEPALFSRLLGIHARELPAAELGIDGALRLVYRLVTG